MGKSIRAEKIKVKRNTHTHTPYIWQIKIEARRLCLDEDGESRKET